MLQIQNIKKQYKTGYLIQQALDNVSLSFRDSEFVSILGPSGSGKTTLLNIIGGLDQYDSGELMINGISTKKYRDKDWDSYRNHTVGFVFQSYNLIPHQSILANVELALTISGISRRERRQRAEQVLTQVGLGDQLHKRPNQMSGGQMQRVAIARALVNNPSILLADEPTGALDTATSLQIMELLREVSKERLVVMVTHNSELAERYSTRIVKLQDGRITDDSAPYTPEVGELPTPKYQSMGRAKMSLLTALSLSFNNLRTKKGRTLLTSIAGSIGIIGIALILALSSSVNRYIADMQKDTMTSYPITISAETFDMSGMMAGGQRIGGPNTRSELRDGVHADYRDIELSETVFASIIENNLTTFKSYLDDPNSEIHQYLGENGFVYTYDACFDVYSYDANGVLINSGADVGTLISSGGGFSSMPGGIGDMSMMMGGSAGAENFSELMASPDGNMVSHIVTDSYEMLYGAWPEHFDEVVLVLDENRSLSAGTLYQLGLLTAEDYEEASEQIKMGEEVTAKDWSYEEISGHRFYLVLPSSYYAEHENGTFSYIGDKALNAEQLLEDALELKICGIVKPREDAANAVISTAVAYTSQLTDYVIQQTDGSAVVLAQEANQETNVLTGMKFETLDDAEKIVEASAYISAMGISDKASLYSMILYYSSADAQGTAPAEQQSELRPMQGAGQISTANMDSANMDEAAMAQALDVWLAETPDNEILLSVYNEYIDGASYADNMKKFGKVSYDAPASISIYTDSFEDKNAVSACIERYNDNADEAGKITYTDYVALLTSSITSMVDVISYVLIAFVAVSLVVSCIMIGIITHISVMERTKEIGILRALGASKHNVSQVFNAETFIVGICAGLLGVGVSALLTIPINAVLESLLGIGALTVALPAVYAVVLVALSVVITMIGGLLPAKRAAKQDAVIALRTE